MLIKKKLRREKKRRGENIPACGGENKKKRSSWGEKWKKEMDVDVFYIKGWQRRRRRRRRRRGAFVMKWGILVFLLGHFTDG